MFTTNGTPGPYSATSNGAAGTSALARLRPLLELANLVRVERELEDLLESIAETISSALG
jgi:hypothetical protein